jgi:two-component system, LytTR family, response regulator
VVPSNDIQVDLEDTGQEPYPAAQMRTLIVDHEPLARATLRHLCEADDSIDEVAVAECGATAIEMIRADRPDLLLLDVELRDMTGFDVLRSLEHTRRPAVIMVAAHEKHAVEAFRSGAVDYLTKPVGASRFASAIERVHERCDTTAPIEQNADTAKRRRSPARLMAENSHRLYFLAVEDVDYIESCGNYVLIHVGEHKYLRRDTLKRLASELREAGFEWIRRSTLINLARVAFAEKLGHGALAFTLTCGTRLVSKTRVKLAATRAGSFDDEEL